MKKEIILVALGGNAILKSGQSSSIQQQMENIDSCCELLAPAMEKNTLVITHGNGPQIGNMLLQQDLAAGAVSPMPFDACSGAVQGLIGYMLRQSLANKLAKKGLPNKVVCMLSSVEVSKTDSAFRNFTKPIGGFYPVAKAKELEKEKGWQMMEDSGRGYRRLVPSPKPMEIVERDAIYDMLHQGYTVVACGGGGIPVVNENGILTGVDAVVDKDLTAALLGKSIKSDKIVFVTEVENVYLNFGKKNAKKLEKVTATEMERYLNEGHFGAGSMGPKIAAAVDYVQSTGGTAIICSLEKVGSAIEGLSGTIINN